MGKLLCDSASIAETYQNASPTVAWRDTNTGPFQSMEPVNIDHNAASTTTAAHAWDDVAGLEDQQRRQLQKLHAKGVLWKHPEDDSSSPSRSVVFRLSYGGDVSADGNCLFTATQKAMASACDINARELRRRTVKRFLEDLGSANIDEIEQINDAIRHMYSADLKNGWGVHVVQEVKLLAKKEDRMALDSSIDELLELGMQREQAAESIYKERCIPVNDGASWAKYMSTSSSGEDEYDIITLQYTEEGLLSVDENREGHSAAFGDDIAIECLATEFKREIYVSMKWKGGYYFVKILDDNNKIVKVTQIYYDGAEMVFSVQAHGLDAMVDEDNCVFFLPHRPRSQICDPPLFLFMKGTGWCGAGGDHYEPLIAHPCQFVTQEKVALVL